MRPAVTAKTCGFTRTELTFVLCAVSLLVFCGLVFQLQFGAKGKRNACAKNMKEVGLAATFWMEDHWGQPPWRTTTNDGGNLGLQTTARNQTWFHFAWLSNELSSPRFLVDPAEKRPGLRAAKTWDANPIHGLANDKFQDNACSYGLGLDFILGGTGIIPDELCQNAILVTDGHLRGEAKEEACARAALQATAFTIPFKVWWSDDIHGSGGGNIMRTGAWMQYQDAKGIAAILPANREYGPPRWELRPVAHFLFPRRESSESMK